MPPRPLFESLEDRQLFACASLADAVEAYVLMRCPNDFKAAEPPPYVVQEQYAARPTSGTSVLDGATTTTTAKTSAIQAGA